MFVLVGGGWNDGKDDIKFGLKREKPVIVFEIEGSVQSLHSLAVRGLVQLRKYVDYFLR